MSGPMRPAFALLAVLLSLSFAASPFFVDGFGGFDPNQFPVPQDNPPVQPAGYAFGIWGLIYIWLILGMAWGAIRALRDGQWHDMRVPLCLSLAVGTTWLAVAVMSPIWAAVLIWVMLITALIALFVAPVEDPLWAAAPVGLYAGWLSAASCVSLALLAAGYGYLDGETAAAVFIGLAVVLGLIVQTVLGRIPTYGIAVIWGLLGPRGKAVCDLLIFGIGLFVMGVFFKMSFDFAAESWAVKEYSNKSIWQPPLYPIKSVIPIAVGLVWLQNLAEFLRALLVALGIEFDDPREDEAPDDPDPSYVPILLDGDAEAAVNGRPDAAKKK